MKEAMLLTRVLLTAFTLSPVLGYVLPEHHPKLPSRLLRPDAEQKDISLSFVDKLVERVADVVEDDGVWERIGSIGKGKKKHRHGKKPKHGPGHGPGHGPDHGHPHDEVPGDGDKDKTILKVISDDPAFNITAHVISHREEIAEKLDDSDVDVTLLAPVNSAFPHRRKHKKHHPPEEKITEAVLYHIVKGTHNLTSLRDGDLLTTCLHLSSLADRPQKIRVFEHNHHVAFNFHSRIIKDDIAASNGVIQALDHFLLPPPNAVKVLGHFPGMFGVFLVAAKKVGLVHALEETKAITVFAPTNRAFKKLGVKKLKYLFSREGRRDLKKILSYHVSNDLVYGPDLRGAKSTDLSTWQGENLSVKFKDDDSEHGHKHPVIEINGSAHVIITDGLARNGAIHVIDTVLIPSEHGNIPEDEEEENVFDIIYQLLWDEEVEDDRGFRFGF